MVSSVFYVYDVVIGKKIFIIVFIIWWYDLGFLYFVLNVESRFWDWFKDLVVIDYVDDVDYFIIRCVIVIFFMFFIFYYWLMCLWIVKFLNFVRGWCLSCIDYWWKLIIVV